MFLRWFLKTFRTYCMLVCMCLCVHVYVGLVLFFFAFLKLNFVLKIFEILVVSVIYVYLVTFCCHFVLYHVFSPIFLCKICLIKNCIGMKLPSSDTTPDRTQSSFDHVNRGVKYCSLYIFWLWLQWFLVGWVVRQLYCWGKYKN